MAQLCQEYNQFVERDTEVIVVGPESKSSFQDYWRKEKLPFYGIPDPNHEVLKLYGQEVNIFKFGRMPAQVTIDKNGLVRYVHYGKSMADIPTNQEILGIIEQLNSEKDSMSQKLQ